MRFYSGTVKLRQLMASRCVLNSKRPLWRAAITPDNGSTVNKTPILLSTRLTAPGLRAASLAAEVKMAGIIGTTMHRKCRQFRKNRAALSRYRQTGITFQTNILALVA